MLLSMLLQNVYKGCSTYTLYALIQKTLC